MTDGASGGVAGVDKSRFTGGGPLLVQALEGSQRQVDLAADFDQGRRLLPRLQAHDKRYGPDGAQVAGDVLSHHAVAAGGAASEVSVLIYERDRQSIDLGFGHIGGGGRIDPRLLQQLRQAAMPVVQLLLVAGIGQGIHGPGMLDLLERFQRLGTDALRGRIGGQQLGELDLQLFQFIEEPVILGVADLRLIEHIIEVIMALKLRPEFLCPLYGFLRRFGHRLPRLRLIVFYLICAWSRGRPVQLRPHSRPRPASKSRA